MARVLLIDGTVRPDGTPLVLPAGAWVPSGGDGASKTDEPGSYLSYISDRLSGIQRPLQRPRFEYVARLPFEFDVAEMAAPLRRIGKPGLLFQGERANDFSSGDWDLSSWTGAAVVVTSGKEGPTGETTGLGQAYELNPNSINHTKSIALGTLNTHTTTYVCSMWVRIPDGTDNHTVSLRINGGTVTTKTYSVTKEWQKIWIPTVTQGGATSHNLFIFPGGVGDTNDPVQVWGPVFEDVLASAGVADAAIGTTVEPTGTRLRGGLTGSFSWPTPPWTLYLRFTPLWGDDDGEDHQILNIEDPAGNWVWRVNKSSADTMRVQLQDREGVSRQAFVSPAIDPREEWRVIIKHGSDGSLSGWLNESAFTTNLAAGVAYGPGDATVMEMANGGSGEPPDFKLHQMELWDEDIDEVEFYGRNMPLGRAA